MSDVSSTWSHTENGIDPLVLDPRTYFDLITSPAVPVQDSAFQARYGQNQVWPVHQPGFATAAAHDAPSIYFVDDNAATAHLPGDVVQPEHFKTLGGHIPEVLEGASHPIESTATPAVWASHLASYPFQQPALPEVEGLTAQVTSSDTHSESKAEVPETVRVPRPGRKIFHDGTGRIIGHAKQEFDTGNEDDYVFISMIRPSHKRLTQKPLNQKPYISPPLLAALGTIDVDLPAIMEGAVRDYESCRHSTAPGEAKGTTFMLEYRECIAELIQEITASR